MDIRQYKIVADGAYEEFKQQFPKTWLGMSEYHESIRSLRQYYDTFRAYLNDNYGVQHMENKEITITDNEKFLLALLKFS